MRTEIVTGIAIGIGCAAWTLLMGFTGWYQDPAMVNAFFAVILIEVVLLVWGLRRTAAGNGYGRQVLLGTAMAAVAAPILFLNSLLFTRVLFPSYFADVAAMGRKVLEARGMPPAEIEAAMAAQAATQTPLLQALIGAVATVLTGFVASLAIAAFARRGRG